MDYGVMLELSPPPGLSDLDMLQRAGIASLLDEVLDEYYTDDLHHPEGAPVLYHAMGHANGAQVELAVAATDEECAAAEARRIMGEALELNRHLAGWSVTGCEVDPTRFADPGLSVDSDHPGVDPPKGVELELPAGLKVQPEMLDWRRWITEHADQLRAFDPDTFDEDGQHARLAAGALIFASTVMIDELFRDVAELGDTRTTVADGGTFMVLDELPARFAPRYDARFARRFLTAAVTVIAKLAQTAWTTPASVAEALALHLVVEGAKTLLDVYDLSWDDVETVYDQFSDAAFDDLDHEWLYEMSMDGFEDDEFHARLRATDMRVEAWFRHRPIATGYANPYGLDLKPPTVGTPANERE